MSIRNLLSFSLLFLVIVVAGATALLDLPCDKSDPPDEIAIVQLSFDGINTFHCGVGTVVQQTQAVLTELNVEGRYPHFKLHLVSGDYSPELLEYASATLSKNIDECRMSGGAVHLIPIHKNDEMFGDPEQWVELCEEGARICADIINKNPYTIIIAHDTAYAQLPIQLSMLARAGAIHRPHKVLWVPHATSWTYNGHTIEGIPNWPERHQWELEAFQQATQRDYIIGYISPQLKQTVMSAPFGVKETALIPYRTGILLDRYSASVPVERVAEELQKRSIPLDKRLIFSIGRANPLKGLDITLEMYRHLEDRYSDIHLVLLAPESDFMPSYLAMLKERIASEKLNVTLIDEFDPDLAHYLYQWPKTAIVSLLSRSDTRPLTVMEARVNPRNSTILVSNPERMGNQVTDGVDGFTCSLADLEDVIEDPMDLNDSLELIVERAQTILELSTTARKEIIEAGHRLVSEEYDLRTNMQINLDNLLKPKGYSKRCSEYIALSRG